MSYFVNMKIINNTWIVNFCLTDWFLLEIKGCKRKKWSRLVGTFPFWHHWALTHGPTRVSTHTHIVLFTSAQRVWIFTILNFQYRVTFKVDKMTHSLCDLYIYWFDRKHNVMTTLYRVYGMKIEKRQWKMTNNCCHCMNLCGFMWLKVYQPPHLGLGQPHIYITATWQYLQCYN